MTLKEVGDRYRGRKVLVTGDTGFKGAWLAFWLHRLGAHVLGYALPPRRDQNPYRLLGLSRKIRHVNGDIRDQNRFQRVMKEFSPEFLFHLAAQSLVRPSYESPVETFSVNVGGTATVLEACRRAPKLRSVVLITSDKCYRNREWVWGYRETDSLGGDDPYSASKAAAETVYTAFARSYFDGSSTGVATVRAGNVIGGGDWAKDRVIPDCVRALKRGAPIVLRRPEATRPWQHVLEPLSGYLTLAVALADRPKEFAGSWNFGPNEEACLPVRSLVKTFLAHWGGGRVEVRREVGGLRETTFLFLNCDKAKRLLSWRPRWTVDKALAETARWYQNAERKEHLTDLTWQQIQEYAGNVP